MLIMCTRGTGQGKIPGSGGRLVSPPHDLPVKTLLAGGILKRRWKIPHNTPYISLFTEAIVVWDFLVAIH